MSEPAQQTNTALRELRQRAELSAAELARRAGVAPNTVLNAERGSKPAAERRRRIALALAEALAVADAIERARADASSTPELGAELERQLWPELELAVAA
jgi:transcriptional regulator with XRE-family HTH domain